MSGTTWAQILAQATTFSAEYDVLIAAGAIGAVVVAFLGRLLRSGR